MFLQVKFQQKDMTSTPICGVRLTIDPTMKLEGRTVEFSIDYQALVDGLLWSIQPEILSLKLDCKPNIQFLEVPILLHFQKQCIVMFLQYI